MQVDVPEENENQEDDRHMVDSANLDLETMAAQYKGMARLLRLLYVADHCPLLAVEALRIALSTVMTTFNTSLYLTIHKKLLDATASQTVREGSVPAVPPLDTQWIETTNKKAAIKLEKLDIDLKNYKSNSIKESIRRGHDDVGDHYLECGDLVNALKCYSRSRDYCTSAKHVVNMCLNVIKVSIYLHNWSHVISYVGKAENTPNLQEGGKEGANQGIMTQLHCTAGLADLATRKYKSAARYFLQANFDLCDFAHIMSPNDVTKYGVLCAMASFDRSELQRLVIGSSSFKLFLELEPQMRDILMNFYNSKYAACLKMLDEIKDSLLLDMYLAIHVKTLYELIRSRALCQYFSPYQSADMNKMAVAFNTTVVALENELMQLILDGQINARIDSQGKIVYAKEVDQRSATFEKTLATGLEYQRRTTALILRSAVIKANIQVKSPPREGGQGFDVASSGQMIRN